MKFKISLSGNPFFDKGENKPLFYNKIVQDKNKFSYDETVSFLKKKFTDNIFDKAVELDGEIMETIDYFTYVISIPKNEKLNIKTDEILTQRYVAMTLSNEDDERYYDVVGSKYGTEETILLTIKCDLWTSYFEQVKFDGRHEAEVHRRMPNRFKKTKDGLKPDFSVLYDNENGNGDNLIQDNLGETFKILNKYYESDIDNTKYIAANNTPITDNKGGEYTMEQLEEDWGQNFNEVTQEANPKGKHPLLYYYVLSNYASLQPMIVKNSVVTPNVFSYAPIPSDMLGTGVHIFYAWKSQDGKSGKSGAYSYDIEQYVYEAWKPTIEKGGYMIETIALPFPPPLDSTVFSSDNPSWFQQGPTLADSPKNDKGCWITQSTTIFPVGEKARGSNPITDWFKRINESIAKFDKKNELLNKTLITEKPQLDTIYKDEHEPIYWTKAIQSINLTNYQGQSMDYDMSYWIDPSKDEVDKINFNATFSSMPTMSSWIFRPMKGYYEKNKFDDRFSFENMGEISLPSGSNAYTNYMSESKNSYSTGLNNAKWNAGLAMAGAGLGVLAGAQPAFKLGRDIHQHNKRMEKDNVSYREQVDAMREVKGKNPMKWSRSEKGFRSYGEVASTFSMPAVVGTVAIAGAAIKSYQGIRMIHAKMADLKSRNSYNPNLGREQFKDLSKYLERGTRSYFTGILNHNMVDNKTKDKIIYHARLFGNPIYELKSFGNWSDFQSRCYWDYWALNNAYFSMDVKNMPEGIDEYFNEELKDIRLFAIDENGESKLNRYKFENWELEVL